jgi:hypothetical protein
MTSIEVGIGVAIVVVVVLLGFSMGHTKDKFEAVCDKAHGTTIFDGRQYQCITAQKNP